MPLRLKDTHSSLERVSCVEMVADPIYPEEKLEHTFVRYIVPVPINLKIWCIVSHRSGETEDDFIADLAFGTKCYGLKAGAPSMPERAAKYNRLLKIQPN